MNACQHLIRMPVGFEGHKGATSHCREMWFKLDSKSNCATSKSITLKKRISVFFFVV